MNTHGGASARQRAREIFPGNGAFGEVRFANLGRLAICDGGAPPTVCLIRCQYSCRHKYLSIMLDEALIHAQSLADGPPRVCDERT